MSENQTPILYAKITLEGFGSYIQPIKTLNVALEGELDGATAGTKITIELIEMTPNEYEALPEFEGH